MAATSAPAARAASRRRLARPVIFGLGDGMVSLLGTVFYLSGHQSLVLPGAISGGLTSAVSMAGFDWLSDDNDRGFGESAMLGIATGTGCVLPALPYAVCSGAAAMASSVVICLALGAGIALLRPNRGKGLSLLETGGVLAAAFAVVLLCVSYLPGGAA
ncbi:MAG TPA: hypothetical protein VGH54_21700 [Mycobacterium sp.]|jgi:hypothetical protein|uniref:hypothetical protein n=1 Tax=Mycobacterium sp. TaxID=1785 RepID=UPI002F423F49